MSNESNNENLPFHTYNLNYFIVLKDIKTNTYLSYTKQINDFDDNGLKLHFNEQDVYALAYTDDYNSPRSHWRISKIDNNYSLVSCSEPKLKIRLLKSIDKTYLPIVTRNGAKILGNYKKNDKKGYLEVCDLGINLDWLIKGYCIKFKLPNDKHCIVKENAIANDIDKTPARVIRENSSGDHLELYPIIIPGYNAKLFGKKDSEHWKTLYSMENSPFVNRTVSISISEGYSISNEENYDSSKSADKSLSNSLDKSRSSDSSKNRDISNTLDKSKSISKSSSDDVGLDMGFFGGALGLNWGNNSSTDKESSLDTSSSIDFSSSFDESFSKDISISLDTDLSSELSLFSGKTNEKTKDETTTISVTIPDDIKTFQYQQRFTCIRRYIHTEIFGEIFVDRITVAHPEYRSIVDPTDDKIKNELDRINKILNSIPNYELVDDDVQQTSTQNSFSSNTTTEGIKKTEGNDFDFKKIPPYFSSKTVYINKKSIKINYQKGFMVGLKIGIGLRDDDILKKMDKNVVKNQKILEEVKEGHERIFKYLEKPDKRINYLFESKKKAERAELNMKNFRTDFKIFRDGGFKEKKKVVLRYSKIVGKQYGAVIAGLVILKTIDFITKKCKEVELPSKADMIVGLDKIYTNNIEKLKKVIPRNKMEIEMTNKREIDEIFKADYPDPELMENVKDFKFSFDLDSNIKLQGYELRASSFDIKDLEDMKYYQLEKKKI